MTYFKGEIGAVKARLWISNSMSFWALVEEIRSKENFKDVNETLFYCVNEMGKNLGLKSDIRALT